MISTTATKHPHHFDDLSPDDFERFIYWLVKRSRDFSEVQWYGGARDRGRDIVAYKHTATGREKWYIQCKRYQSIDFATLREELDKLAEHAKRAKDFAPDVIVFATACSIPPQIKDQATAHSHALALPEPYYWGRWELDEGLKAQPETEQEFFGLGDSGRKTTGAGKRPVYAIAGLVVGAGVDLLVNLLAAAIQQRAFADQFSTSAVWWLAGLCGGGLLLGYWLGAQVSLSLPAVAHSRAESDGETHPIVLTRLRALLSYTKLRGWGISIVDVLLIGSCLNVETDTQAKG